MSTSLVEDSNRDIFYYVLNNDIINVEKSLKKGSNPNTQTQTGLSLIGHAAKQGSKEILKLLLEYCYEHSSSEDLEDLEPDIFNNLNLHEKKIATPDEMNELMWDYEIELPTITDIEDDEWTQLFKYYGQIIEKTHQYLITTKLDPHALDRHYLSPIHYAAMNGHIDCVQLLINYGCSVNIETRCGYTPLHLAGDHKDIIELLLKNKANPNKITYEKLETPLMTATKKGDVKWMSLLIEYGANVNALNCMEQSALTLGVINNQYNAVRLLIKYKVKLNELDFDGFSPIYYALEYKHKEILQLLLDNGAKIQPINCLLQDCLKRELYDITKILINSGININFRLNDKMSPLHASILYSDSSMVEHMINNGARLGCTLEYDHKEIHLLMTRKSDKTTLIKILNVLFESGVDLNEESGYKKKPLEVALISRNFIAAIMIIKEGANVNIGPLITTYDYLKIINFIEFIKFLVYAGYKIMSLKKQHQDNFLRSSTASLTDSITDELQFLYRNPLTLKQQCRIIIRNNLVKKIKIDQLSRHLLRPSIKNNSFIESYAEKLNLPVCLKSYICEFTDVDL